MGALLSIVPRGVLAFLLVALGIVVIVLIQPPHSVCDSQIQVVDRNQQKFLYKDPKSKHILTTKYERLRNHCFETNNPGGCYELFQELKTMLYDLGSLSGECSVALSGKTEYKRAVWESVELLVDLAWGKAPPQSYGAKLGWLEVSDVTLYCRLKDRILTMYGESSWEAFRERKMRDFPGALDMPRNQIWDLSLFSENCAKYP